MVDTYKRGAVNIAISIPLYLLIASSILIKKTFLVLNIVPLTISYILFFSLMYRLYTNKKIIYYNIGQFISLLFNVIVIYYIYNSHIINSLIAYFT